MAKVKEVAARATVVALAALSLEAGAVKVSVNLDEVKAEVPRTIYGTGMEDVNHEIYGGLDAQRLWDESFEEELPPQVIPYAQKGKGGISHGGACGTWGEANINTRKARLYMVNFQGKSKASKAFHAEWKRRTELTSAR